MEEKTTRFNALRGDEIRIACSQCDNVTALPDRLPRGFEGASSRLVNDLIREGKLEDEDIAELMRISFESGGLSVDQVRHVISSLEREFQKSKRSV